MIDFGEYDAAVFFGFDVRDEKRAARYRRKMMV